MASTVTRQQNLKTNQKNQERRNNSWLSIRHGAVPSQEKMWENIFSPCFTHSNLQPPPPILLYRLALKGLNEGNLVSPGRECTRWLTCLQRRFGDLSWCHVEWHMLTSALFLYYLICALKILQYLHFVYFIRCSRALKMGRCGAKITKN